MVAIHDGRSFTQRALAAELGIRQSSLRHALKSLETGCLIALRPYPRPTRANLGPKSDLT